MRGSRLRTTRWWVAAGLVAGLTLAGCSADNSDMASTSGAAPALAPAEEPAGGEPAAEDADQPAAGAATSTEKKEAPNLAVDQRSIVYTGSITVRVDDVNTAAARVTAIVAGAGGFIGGDKRSSSGDKGPSDATLTLRVPADRFSNVVDQLAGLGKEEQRGLSTDDVTEETVDLDARIATQQARVTSGRALLAKATTLENLVMLEREVATRESDLASLQAKKRRLADLTSLSTITAVLIKPREVNSTVEDDAPADSKFVAGLKDGWDGLTTTLGVVATVLGWLLPWLVLAGVPVAIWWTRRRRRRAATVLEGAGD
ncbi:DUF4349 domain-containing protein [Actinoplanes sp. NPDC051494]|uniref:DUF4349 domain-containing protein n=1 Tax=Actinoplanes sp. NPDC051494 TaxID=3363907 RepID=UPI0037B58DAC